MTDRNYLTLTTPMESNTGGNCRARTKTGFAEQKRFLRFFSIGDGGIAWMP